MTNFLFKKLKNLYKKLPIKPKTPLIYRDSESKNSMMGSVYSKPPQTCGEWQNQFTRKADFIDS